MKQFSEMIVFDFDGVISNSVHDSFLTALNAYAQYSSNHSLPFSQTIKPSEIFEFEKANKQLFEGFWDLLPLGNQASDYYAVLKIIEEGKSGSVQTQDDFDEYRTGISGDILKTYSEAFYKLRVKMQDENPREWAELLPPFPGIVQAIHQLNDQFFLAIATAKDCASVHILTEKYGLSDIFPNNRIYDKEQGESKRVHLTRLHEDSGIPFNKIRFIDDKVSHLFSVQDLGVQSSLAAWGFNSEREQSLARENGFGVLAIQDLRTWKPEY